MHVARAFVARHAIALICLTFFILGSLYAIYTPIFEASDEVWHYPMVAFIAQTWQLPVQPLEPGSSSGPWRQEGSQPPLYYGLGALLTFWIDTGDLAQVRHLNPHVAAGEITPDGHNPNLVVHNPALERFPWRGTVLAVHLVRFLSVLLGTWAVYLTWVLVRTLYPDPPWLAPVTAAVHAFTPMYLFISASVNNDALIVPLCTLALLQMVQLVKEDTCGGEASPLRTALLPYLKLGITLGLALLTKASALGLLPLAAAAIAWKSWRLHVRSHAQHSATHLLRALSFFATRLGLTLGTAGLLAGWWFYRNFRLYGDWLGLNAFYAVLGTRAVPADLRQLWAERHAFAAGYWGNFGGLNVPFPAWTYTLLNVFALFALVTATLRLIVWLTGYNPATGERRAPPLWPFHWDNLTAARALAWAWPAIVFVSWVRWATVTWSSQGRLIFSAIPMWSLFLVLGTMGYPLRRPQKHLHVLPVDLAVILLLLSLTALPLRILPAYTPPKAVADLRPRYALDVRFGDLLRLRGYDLGHGGVPLRPGGTFPLTLYWEALTPSETDHSIFIHILGEGDRIIAQRDTFPGKGLLSTTWLEPGRMWVERYAIPIPPMAYAPDRLTVAVGVYETWKGARLPAFAAEGEALGERVTFGDLLLTPNTGDVPNPIDVRFGRGIRLRGYDLSALHIRPGRQLTVTLYWEATADGETDYTLSVQLLDAQWRKAAQVDAPTTRPTSRWREGDRFTEVRHLTIAPDALPGLYDLQLTFYRLVENGELMHLPVVWEEGQLPAEWIVLTTIRVE